MKKRIIYIGNLVNIPEYLYFDNNYILIGIFCEEERVNKELLTFTMVREVPLVKISNKNRIEDAIDRFGKNTIFLVCSYGKRIPIERCKNKKIFNIHYAELPKYKGRHPTYWATIKNEKFVGISLHRLTEDFDRGDIISQKLVPYYLWENEVQLFEKLTSQVPELLKDFNNHLERNCNDFIIQNRDGDYYPRVEEKDILINLHIDTPKEIFNKVRSQARASGAKVSINKKNYVLFNVFFIEKVMTCDFYIDTNLYIKYTNSICLVSSIFKEI